MSFSYQTTTISELMSELDSLGGTSRVKMYPTYLTALVRGNMKIQHFSSGDGEYITYQNIKKKYYYDQVLDDLTQKTVDMCLRDFDEGFNVTVILYGNLLQELLRLIYKQDEFAITHHLYPMDPTQPPTSLIQQQTKTKSDYYQWDTHLKITPSKTQITLTKIISKSNPTSQLKIISLSPKTFQQTSQCKSQLFQLIDSLGKNQNKSGKEIANQLFMKKHKIVSMFIENAFNDSVNYLIHDCSGSNEGVLEFCNKFRRLSNFSVKGEETIDQTVVKIPIKHSVSNYSGQKAAAKSLENKQLQYCRRLERKTHKYSVKPLSHQQEESLPIQETIPTKQRIFLSAEEEIQVLKSQHLVEISKYHQTIQSLNSKLLIMAKEKGLEELCGAYEKEIMGLQLKIQELREDMGRVCGGSKEELKIVIKRLNEEIKVLEKRRVRDKENKGVPNDKVKSLESKLKESEEARNQLVQELRTVTNRLQIRQKEIKQFDKKLTQFGTLHPQNISTLPVSSQQQISELNTLLNQLNNGNGQSYIFIKNKVNHLFKNLSDSKTLLLQSNEFLVQLQRLLEQRIQPYDPIAVLDCNRFIRGFLMKCVEIVE